MCNLIVVGHGIYGTSVQRSLSMIYGETPGMYFIDFEPEDSADILRQKLQNAIGQCGGQPILFCCDMVGGTPFNECIKLSVENASQETVAGLNLSAFAEIAFTLDQPLDQLAQQAENATKEYVQWVHL